MGLVGKPNGGLPRTVAFCWRRQQRGDDRHPDEQRDDGERHRDRNRVEIGHEHLGAHEREHEREACLQVDEPVHHAAQQEEHRAQPEDREDGGREVRRYLRYLAAL